MITAVARVLVTGYDKCICIYNEVIHEVQ